MRNAKKKKLKSELILVIDTCKKHDATDYLHT